MTLLTERVIASSRRSSADQHLKASVTNMESPSEVGDPAVSVGDSARRCLATVSPSPPRVTTTAAEDVDDVPTGNGSSCFAPPDELDATPVTRPERSSPSVVRDAKPPMLSFSVAAIMAKSTSPPTSRVQPQSAVELNHNNSQHHHRHRQDCGPISLVSPPAASPRRASAFTVDGILNGVGRTSSRPASADDGDESSCSAADDSESNRSSPGVVPSTAGVSAVNAPVTAKQSLPLLHPSAATIDVAYRCPYPWSYINPPSESFVLAPGL